MMAIVFGLLLIGAFAVAVVIGLHKDKHHDE